MFGNDGPDDGEYWASKTYPFVSASQVDVPKSICFVPRKIEKVVASDGIYQAVNPIDGFTYTIEKVKHQGGREEWLIKKIDPPTEEEC